MASSLCRRRRGVSPEPPLLKYFTNLTLIFCRPVSILYHTQLRRELSSLTGLMSLPLCENLTHTPPSLHWCLLELPGPHPQEGFMALRVPFPSGGQTPLERRKALEHWSARTFRSPRCKRFIYQTVQNVLHDQGGLESQRLPVSSLDSRLRSKAVSRHRAGSVQNPDRQWATHGLPLETKKKKKR